MFVFFISSTLTFLKYNNWTPQKVSHFKFKKFSLAIKYKPNYKTKYHCPTLSNSCHNLNKESQNKEAI